MRVQKPEEMVAGPTQDLLSTMEPGAQPIDPSTLGGRAVRGVLITASFVIAMELLKAVTGLFTARLLQPRDYALFGAAVASLNIVNHLLNLDVNSRLVQAQDDNRDLYDQAFTIQVGLGFLYVVLAIAAGPLVARVYGDSVLVPICIVLAVQALSLPANVALVPLLRDLAWWRQRVVASAGPLLGLAVTLVLAFEHAGVWALVYGQVASTVAMAAVLWVFTPRRPRLQPRIRRDAARYFLTFGGPLWAAGLIGILAGNGLVLEVKLALGLAAIGFFRVAVGLGERIDTAESVVSSVIFPVVCRITDRQRLAQAFDISGRVLLVWAVPAGLGLAVFAEEIQHFVLGPQWHPIIPLLQIEGVVEVANAVATMWSLFYMATGNTRPSMWMGVQVNAVMLVAMGILGHLFGLVGIAGAIGTGSAFALVLRRRFILRLFPGTPVLRGAFPLVAAGVIAAAVALLLRPVFGLDSGPGLGLRLLAFGATYIAAGPLLQRRLLDQVRALVRDRNS